MTRDSGIRPESSPAALSAGNGIPSVTARLSFRDVLGTVRVRLGIGRGRYRVRPGLYALGKPAPESPVLVTANYKLTFDTLRKELGGVNAWILVLDTKGINVWCAAGKGTFGTKELVNRIINEGLEKIVSHRTVICPQLGAVGVAAHTVKSFTKFQVIYGPVRASDIPAFLKNGMTKTADMRLVKFGLRDRLTLVPVEIVTKWPIYLAGWAVILLLDWIVLREFSTRWLLKSLVDFLPYCGAVMMGSALVPVLLPWIPFRALSLKGLAVGSLWFAAVFLLHRPAPFDAAGTFLIIASISSFFAMNFTGSTTYTSLSGAELEVRIGSPVMITAMAAGIVLKALTAFRVLA